MSPDGEWISDVGIRTGRWSNERMVFEDNSGKHKLPAEKESA